MNNNNTATKAPVHQQAARRVQPATAKPAANAAFPAKKDGGKHGKH